MPFLHLLSINNIVDISIHVLWDAIVPSTLMKIVQNISLSMSLSKRTYTVFISCKMLESWLVNLFLFFIEQIIHSLMSRSK
jgi:hypothetical protein